MYPTLFFINIFMMSYNVYVTFFHYNIADSIKSMYGTFLSATAKISLFARRCADDSTQGYVLGFVFLGIVHRAGKLFDYPRVLKSCFNAYILSSLEYCAPVLVSSAESNLGLLDSVVRIAERMCGGRWDLFTVRKGCLMVVLYKIRL